MELKKSKKANLERRFRLHIFVGIIISLSLVLISFEWSTRETVDERLSGVPEIEIELDLPPLIRDEKPKTQKTPPILMPIPVPVDEDIPIDTDPIFDVDPDDINWDDILNHIPKSEPEVIVDTTYIIVEIMPTFAGGNPNTTFYRYIMQNLVFPQEAIDNGISGRVQVRFVINDRGMLEQARIVRSVHPVLDQEALRVINSSPRWEPGIQSGKRVRVQFDFPINFVLR